MDVLQLNDRRIRSLNRNEFDHDRLLLFVLLDNFPPVNGGRFRERDLLERLNVIMNNTERPISRVLCLQGIVARIHDWLTAPPCSGIEKLKPGNHHRFPVGTRP